ncbi:MAG: lamin tail domain-containing protein [Phycisphaerales bacterium]|nr:lamin tail domain-containing protein [Phycisphaerales bacterium]
MRSYLVHLGAVTALASPALGQARVIITEIMYNPNSKQETVEKTEWVEIANVGDQPIEMKDWRLDDEDKREWGKFTATLAPGGVLVLVDNAVTEKEFRQAWDQPPVGDESAAKINYQIIPVKWSNLANKPDAANEVLQLRNDKDVVVCEVKQQGEGWPNCTKPDGPSIWLSDIAAKDLSNGKLWQRSESAKNGSRTNEKTELFNGADIGSPGFVPGLNAAPTSAKPDAAPKAPDASKDKPKSDNTVDY